MMGRVQFCVALCVLVGLVGASDVGKSMVQLVQERGYPIESYEVTTPDGYILGVFRIPKPNAPVVFLQHGLLDSSYTWVNNFQNESLAYVLSNNGYDVWMGNSRGNTFSTKHQTLNPKDDAFWNFSWDEMAKYDMPTMIEFALKSTGKSSLSYYGHSQGTIQAFAAFSKGYVTNEQVNVFIALAPVAYVNHQKSLLLSLMADFDLASIIKLLGFGDFLPSNDIINKIAPGLCKIIPWGCEDFIFLLTGFSHNLNTTRMDVYTYETPAGTSVKNMVHWSQGVRADDFQMYDYGCGLFSCDNEKYYHQKTPPSYPLNNITVPTALYHGTDDWLADEEDVALLMQQLPQNTQIRVRNVQGFEHLDFTWGVDANRIVYSDTLDLLTKYNPGAVPTGPPMTQKQAVSALE